jgi:hypothetical protein
VAGYYQLLNHQLKPHLLANHQKISTTAELDNWPSASFADESH